MKKFWISSLSLAGWLCSAAAAGAVVKRAACPTQVEPMVALMLRDLPGYANRAISRSTRRSAVRSISSVLTAGRPEFAPLPLKPGDSVAKPSGDLHQVFLTTLERQNTGGKPIDLQQFHWLFLAQTQSGWRLALMFTRTGTYPATPLLTPPRESSQGAIGQAVQVWLRDCNAGAIRQ